MNYRRALPRRNGETWKVPCVLYRAWENMRSRVRGEQRGGPRHVKNYWEHCTLDPVWASYDRFREWALANGFNRTGRVMDRIDPLGGYAPSNCRWISKRDNMLLCLQRRTRIGRFPKIKEPQRS